MQQYQALISERYDPHAVARRVVKQCRDRSKRVPVTGFAGRLCSGTVN